jgi:predicted AlkP superfamily pyrophosphatase or phosphodiesterase
MPHPDLLYHTRKDLSLSTKPRAAGPREGGFERVFWVVLDGMGHEHALRALQTGRFPSLSRLEQEGYLGPSRPSSPVCQTPPALLALFTGAEPRQAGVWGFRMPDPARPGRSVSGFHVHPRSGRTIWSSLEEAGARYSLMNVAFRNDPVWSADRAHLDLGWDAYRLWSRPASFRLRGNRQEHEYRGIAFNVARDARGVTIRKGSAVRARLAPGAGAIVELTRGCRVFAQLVDPVLLAFSPLIPAMVRGTAAADVRQHAAHDGALDSDAFRLCRRLNKGRDTGNLVPLESEMLLARVSMQQKAHVMERACAVPGTRLVVGYFPLVDEFSHAYIDRLDPEWPHGRAAEVFLACMGLVDSMLGRLMEAAGPGTLLVVSSDHGAMPHRSMLHLNERFVEAGLVRRAAAGYDLARSAAYYHPSGCGQVLLNSQAAARAGRTREEALRRVSAIAAAEGIGLVEGSADDPYLAFLYPLTDRYFTGSPPRHGRPALDQGSAGGHHLSPLSPTPWINAVLGLWRRGGARDDFPSPPAANLQLKDFILSMLGVDGGTGS